MAPFRGYTMTTQQRRVVAVSKVVHHAGRQVVAIEGKIVWREPRLVLIIRDQGTLSF